MMSGQGAHRMEDGFQKTREFLKFLSQREEKRDAVLKERKRKAEMKRAREEMMRQQQELKVHKLYKPQHQKLKRNQ